MEKQEVVIGIYNEIPVCMFCLEGSEIEEIDIILCPGGNECIMHVHRTCFEDWFDHYPEDPSCPLCRTKMLNSDDDTESATVRILPLNEDDQQVECLRDRARNILAWCVRVMCLFSTFSFVYFNYVRIIKLK